MAITKTSIAEYIRSGRFFSCTFVKQDGTTRYMRARAGVKKHLKGGTLKYNPKDFGYYIVFDLDKREYRCVNLITITHFNGQQLA
jgi:hypothetical protein